jgi:hypothetical protein
MRLRSINQILNDFFQFSQEWSARVYIFPIVTFSLLFNSPKFFEMEASVPLKVTDSFTVTLKGLSHEIDLAFDDIPAYHKWSIIFHS